MKSALCKYECKFFGDTRLWVCVCVSADVCNGKKFTTVGEGVRGEVRWRKSADDKKENRELL